MRRRRSYRLTAVTAGLALALTACGLEGEDDQAASDDTEETQETEDTESDDTDNEGSGDADGGEADIPEDGPPITVASFNFPESTILAEIYGQVMEDAGYEVERQLDLGARELIYPEIESGELDFIPEYLGSALVVGFEEEAPEDIESGAEQLNEAFDEFEVEVLEPAAAENANVFVATEKFVEENDVESLEDLDEAGEVTFAGPPECEERDTCYQGLVEDYGLDEVDFESIQESSARLAALENGNNELILLFSTDAVLGEGSGLVALDDPEEIVPPENIVPVMRDEIVEAYGDDLTELINEVSAELDTETLIELNRQASEGIAPDEIASEYLADSGILD